MFAKSIGSLVMRAERGTKMLNLGYGAMAGAKSVETRV